MIWLVELCCVMDIPLFPCSVQLSITPTRCVELHVKGNSQHGRRKDFVANCVAPQRVSGAVIITTFHLWRQLPNPINMHIHTHKLATAAEDNIIYYDIVFMTCAFLKVNQPGLEAEGGINTRQAGSAVCLAWPLLWAGNSLAFIHSMVWGMKNQNKALFCKHHQYRSFSSPKHFSFSSESNENRFINTP